MKTPIRPIFLPLILLAVFMISSCEQNSGTSKGTAKFSVASIEDPDLAKATIADTDLVSYHLMVTVEDKEGNPVLSDELIPVYRFGSGFISEEVVLPAGDYLLTSYMVINSSGEVIYATPVEGAPLAYLVTDPLPVSFTVNGGMATVVAPELLPTGDNEPSDFGYVSFGGTIVKPLGFYTFCVIDNPLIMAPFPQYTTARLTVFAGNGWRYSFDISPSLNHIIIRGGSDIYLFLLEKEGYLPQQFYVTASHLAATTAESPLVLKIPWDSYQWKELILKPGPDGKDAMISNLEPDRNFGDYSYFEATYISEPLLTVMRSNESLIWFDMNSLPKSATLRKVILHLSYDIPLPWDSATVYRETTSGTVVRYGAVLQQITTPWEEDKVTWNNRPSTTTINQVYIWPFIKNANFIDVDVTSIYIPSPYTDNVQYPNYGMMLRLWPDEWTPGFRFASGDHPDISLRPQLVVYYTLP